MRDRTIIGTANLRIKSYLPGRVLFCDSITYVRTNNISNENCATFKHIVDCGTCYATKRSCCNLQSKGLGKRSETCKRIKVLIHFESRKEVEKMYPVLL